ARAGQLRRAHSPSRPRDEHWSQVHRSRLRSGARQVLIEIGALRDCCLEFTSQAVFCQIVTPSRCVSGYLAGPIHAISIDQITYAEKFLPDASGPNSRSLGNASCARACAKYSPTL